MEYAGIIINLIPEELVGQKQLRKKAIVVEEISDREFKGSVVVDFYGDKCDLLNGFKAWDQVKVGLNFRAREYNGKRYNGISGWRVDTLAGGGAAPVVSAATAPATPAAWATSYEDDLPF